VAVGAAALRQLRQGDEKSGLAQPQPFRLLAVPGEAGRPYSFEIAAIGRERQVAFEDLALGKPALDLERARHLLQLGGE
jgi:hypothetical protein